MHNVMKHLNMNTALPEERLQHCVNVCVCVCACVRACVRACVCVRVLSLHGLRGQSTVNIAMCLYDYVTKIHEVLSLQYTASNKL